jgi:deltex-like protein
VETSAVVSEQKDREIANKFEQRLKDSCHGYSPATGTYTTSYATSYCYTSSYQPVMHSGRSSTKHSSSTSSSSQKTPFQPVLSEYSPIETQDCWFSAPLSGQSTIEEALRKLVPEPTFKDKTSTCAVCTCELIDEDDDDDVVDSEVGDTTPMKITDDADAEENGQASSIKSEAKVNDTTSDTNHDGDEGDEVVSLSTCSVKHFFHRECITQALNYCTRCPECFTPVIPVTGPQPQGRMSVSVNKTTTCAGFERASKGTIVIQYSFPSGIQDERHPNPGSSYSGTYRTAYLPNTPEGRVVLVKLQVAFDRRHLFCVGTSLTTGLSNTVVWNSIHHKTCLFGGAFGFPDATYLTRVSEELRAVGIE